MYDALFCFVFAFCFIFVFVLDASCWMSPGSEIIWIFVAFLVMVEVVSDSKVVHILRFIVMYGNQLLVAKLKAPFTSVA